LSVRRPVSCESFIIGESWWPKEVAAKEAAKKAARSLS